MSLKQKTPSTIYFGDMKKYRFKKGKPPKHLTFFIPHVNEYAGVRVFKEILCQKMEQKGIKTETILGSPINTRGINLRSEILGDGAYYSELIGAILHLEDCILRFRTWKEQIQKYGPSSIVFEMHSSLKVSEKTKIPFSDNRRLASSYHMVVPNPFGRLKEDLRSLFKLISFYSDEAKELLKVRNLSFSTLLLEIKKLVNFLSTKKEQIKAVEFAAKLDISTSNPEVFDLYYPWKSDGFFFADNVSDFESNYCAVEFKPTKFFDSDIELVEKVLVLPSKR